MKQFCTYTKVSQINKSFLGDVFIQLYLGIFENPFVLKSFFCTQPTIRIVVQQLTHQVNCICAYVCPLLFIGAEFTPFHLLYYFFIVDTIEGWIATKQYVQYYSYTPQITFFVIVIIQYFWSNVIWSSKFLLHLMFRIKYATCSKVNNGNLRILVIPIEKYILRLKITMHYVSLMTIIHR